MFKMKRSAGSTVFSGGGSSVDGFMAIVVRVSMLLQQE